MGFQIVSRALEVVSRVSRRFQDGSKSRRGVAGVLRGVSGSPKQFHGGSRCLRCALGGVSSVSRDLRGVSGSPRGVSGCTLRGLRGISWGSREPQGFLRVHGALHAIETLLRSP